MVSKLRIIWKQTVNGSGSSEENEEGVPFPGTPLLAPSDDGVSAVTPPGVLTPCRLMYRLQDEDVADV